MKAIERGTGVTVLESTRSKSKNHADGKFGHYDCRGDLIRIAAGSARKAISRWIEAERIHVVCIGAVAGGQDMPERLHRRCANHSSKHEHLLRLRCCFYHADASHRKVNLEALLTYTRLRRIRILLEAL